MGGSGVAERALLVPTQIPITGPVDSLPPFLSRGCTHSSQLPSSEENCSQLNRNPPPLGCGWVGQHPSVTDSRGRVTNWLATCSVCPGLRGCPVRGTFSAKTSNVLGKTEFFFTLMGAPEAPLPQGWTKCAVPFMFQGSHGVRWKQVSAEATSSPSSFPHPILALSLPSPCKLSLNT